MIESFNQFTQTNYQSRIAIVAAAIPFAVAIESALHAIKDVANGNQDGDLSKNVGTAVFYGLCAAHIVPGSHYIGAAAFALYAVGTFEKKDSYVTAQLIGHPLKTILTLALPLMETLGTLFEKTFTFIGVHVLSPLCLGIIMPLIKKINECVAPILKGLGDLFKKLTEHPIWFAVGALVVVAIAYKYVYIPYIAAKALGV